VIVSQTDIAHLADDDIKRLVLAILDTIGDGGDAVRVSRDSRTSGGVSWWVWCVLAWPAARPVRTGAREAFTGQVGGQRHLAPSSLSTRSSSVRITRCTHSHRGSP